MGHEQDVTVFFVLRPILLLVEYRNDDLFSSLQCVFCLSYEEERLVEFPGNDSVMAGPQLK